MNDDLSPEDLSALSDEELAEREAALDTRAAELREVRSERELTDDEIREARQIGAQRDAIQQEAGARQEAAEARSAEADEALRIALGANADDDDAAAAELGADDEAPAEVPADEPVLVPAAVEPQAAAAAPVVEVVEPAPVVVPAEPQAAATRTSRRVRAADLRRPAAAAPREQASAGRFVANAHAAPAVTSGSEVTSTFDLANILAKRRQGFGTIPAGTREFLPMATASKGLEIMSADHMENLRPLRTLQQEAAAKLMSTGGSGLVASGPFCTPLSPIYDFFRLAEVQDPVESSLPVQGAPRGGIRYIPGTCDVDEAADAIGQFAHDHDYEEDGEKPCATLECPSLEDAYVRAITQCVRFGNLQYRTFAEQVEDFMENVAVLFQAEKETYYLDQIDTNSTLVTGYTPYGASRGLLFDMVLAAVAYRKRHRMARNATLAWYAPDWVPDMVKVDIALDSGRAENWVNVSDADVNAFFSRFGIAPVWYADTATGRGQAFSTAQAAGLLNKWPTYVHSYLFAPGTFVRLDGGTLDVGLVRDSTLNRTNDFEMFMEEWIGFAMLGCESIHLVSDPCVTGAAPALATLINCSTYA